MSAPLSVKLGLKQADLWCVLNAPTGFIDSLDSIPLGCELIEEMNPEALGRIVFATEYDELFRLFVTAFEGLQVKGAIWVAWPKKSSNVPTDLTFETVQGLGLSRRLVDNKVCAIDETWTALRFVVPVKLRSGWIAHTPKDS